MAQTAPLKVSQKGGKMKPKTLFLILVFLLLLFVLIPALF